MRTKAAAVGVWILAGTLGVALLSCAATEMRGTEATDLGRKLSTYAFIESNEEMTLIVGTRATRYRAKEAYFPLEIAIANEGLRQLVLTRDSFTLIDSEGNRYPAAGPAELIDSYQHLDVDRDALAELEGIVFNRFAANTRYPSKFSPTLGANVFRSDLVRDLVSLPKFGYLLDFIYFPAPETGLLDQRFELLVQSPVLTHPVSVRFEVR